MLNKIILVRFWSSYRLVREISDSILWLLNWCYKILLDLQVGNLAAPVAEWTVGGTALTSMMDVERRHGMVSSFWNPFLFCHADDIIVILFPSWQVQAMLYIWNVYLDSAHKWEPFCFVIFFVCLYMQCCLSLWNSKFECYP